MSLTAVHAMCGSWQIRLQCGALHDVAGEQQRLYACHDCSTCHGRRRYISIPVSVLQVVESHEQAVCTKWRAYFFVILENVKVCYGFAIRDAVHKPNLESTLVNVITQNVKSPSTLCATGNHFVFSCLCDLAFTSIWSAWMKMSCKVRNGKIERHRRLWMSNIFANNFHLRCAHSPHLIFLPFFSC